MRVIRHGLFTTVLDPHPELARAHFSPGDQIARWDSSWFLATLADQLCHGSVLLWP